jgi:YHYH protein
MSTNKSRIIQGSTPQQYAGRALAALIAVAVVGSIANASADAAVKKRPIPSKRPVTTRLAGTVSASATTTGAAPVSTKATTQTTAATSTATSGTIVNTWTGAKVDPTKLPIGDSSVSTSGPGVGKLYACRAGNPNAPGASADGPWINGAAKTWDSTTKLAVKGEISWPSAKYTETVAGGKRTLTSNNLPVDMKSGTFPIASDDPSYAYDRNPGRITATDTVISLPETGTVASKVSCMSEGAVGMMRNGVRVFNSLDGKGLDAVAHESQDLCQGHPAMTTYHYHNVPSCLRDAATGPSNVVGWISDGFPIVVERDASGALPTNADLDECHGRTSPILLNGKVVTMYHYSATHEFPYFIGCYKGTATRIS